MDHSKHQMTMNMPDMDHGDMVGHMDMCKMNMIFTWDWENTCVVYRWWHVKTFSQFLLTLIAIGVLTAGYEFFNHIYLKYEKYILQQPTSISSNRSIRLKRSLFYGFKVGYSFMLMLVFMTYNGWYMIAVVVGAVIGHNFWGTGVDSSLACH